MLNDRLKARIDRKKEALDALRPLPVMAVKRLEEALLVEWIYNSNAIEGNTLTLRETKLILETGITIGGKSLREHFEVINHRQAIHFVEELVQSDTAISAFHVRQIHQLVLAKIEDENAGVYRTVPVRIAGASHIPPEPWELTALMQAWETWLNDESKTLHPVARAAIAHHKLVKIHPFIDGNGRTSRLLMNLLLMQSGYPTTIIMKINRLQYYRVLGNADKGNPQSLVNFVGRAVERGLTMYLDAVTPQTQKPSKQNVWIPLRKAAESFPYSQEYLSLLARTGRLEARKEGRNWVTTLSAVQAYIDSLEKT